MLTGPSSSCTVSGMAHTEARVSLQPHQPGHVRQSRFVETGNNFPQININILASCQTSQGESFLFSNRATNVLVNNVKAT